MRTQEEILSFMNDKKESLPFRTIDIADKLGLSRSVTSHYLNNLENEKKIVKVNGRPVLWTLKDSEVKNNKPYAFDDFIGSEGSLKGVISQCEAAINYPPNGLSMIITGNSGVGKSFLAKEIYKYSVSRKIIPSRAPFLTLNCADYANNPELLSSILFGYIKGAFTGANTDQAGLLEQANGGYLFLDEVHRLSHENQEKLFNFIDSGEFRRVGENKNSRESKVRLLFATTEQVDDVLLDTFRRRISISINLPDFDKRPLGERINIVYSIFYHQAQRINKTIKISEKVLSDLVNLKSSGNVGRLKNLIKVKCATAYKNQMNESLIYIKNSDLLSDDFVEIDPRDNYNFSNSTLNQSLQQKILKILEKINEEDNFSNSSQVALNSILKLDLPTIDGLYLPGYLKFKHHYNQVIENQFGIKTGNRICKMIYCLYQNELGSKKLSQFSVNMIKSYPRSVHMANYFFNTFQDRNKSHVLRLLMALLLSSYIDENQKMRGVLLAHGDKTATSIQSVVNQLCGGYILDAIDMPIDTNINSIIERTKSLFDSYDHANDVVMIVDMGSLSQLYEEIKGHIGGHLLVIDNLTTAVALDVAIKIQNNTNFKRIATDAEKEYKIHSKYYSGFSNKKNIIISCISGLGISEKIKEMMLPYFSKDIQISTIDYYDLKKKINNHDEKYFEKTFLVLTTTDLPDNFKVPNINIYDLLDESGEDALSKVLTTYMKEDAIEKLNREFLRFFSIEGISERLSFLNPKVIIKEVEDVIRKYENYYSLRLAGKVKLNFYMHIALMIERLIIGRDTDIPVVITEPAEEDFINISRVIFSPLETKYNVIVNDYELSLMYEVFKTVRD